jgi:hypothetical protein
MYTRTSLLQLKHTPNIPVFCAFVSRWLAALRTTEIPPLLYCLLGVSFWVWVWVWVSNYDRRSVDQCLGIKHPPEAYDQIFITVKTVAGLLILGCSLWRKDGSVVYDFCWPSPAQSISGPRPLGVATIFYCLRFETFLFVTSYNSRGYGGGILPRLHTGFSRLFLAVSSSYITSGRTSQKILLNNRRLLFSRIVVGFT